MSARGYQCRHLQFNCCFQAKPLIDHHGRARSGRCPPKTPRPPEPNHAKIARPLCTELPPSGAHSKMYWENTATGDAVVPSSQPEFRRTESSHAQAKALFRLRPCANALGDASSGSATSPQSLKNTPVSPLGSRICKEVLWNLEFAAHDAP